MPELSPRLPCPVCLGVTMGRVAVGPGGVLRVDHCGRCGGAWLEHGEVQRLRGMPAAELWKRVEKRDQRFRMRCHDCHGTLERADETCPACGWSNTLECPACARPMRTESHAGLRLDVCGGCRGVWFDHHELRAIWEAGFDGALRGRALRLAGSPGELRSGPGEVLLDTLFYSPDLAFHGARAAAHAASHVPDLAAVAPEVATGLFEVVGEAAVSVFEVIASIIGGIFEGF
jgi:Zn-finger nucleic acid-binding protein